MPPPVSVVITTWNSVQWLEPCLQSIAALNYDPLEIIIVDNASTDATAEILKRFAPRFRIIWNNTNTGFAAAQNLGFRAARGDWLLSLNPDVLLTPDFITTLVAAGERDPNVGAVCGKLLRWTPSDLDQRSHVIDSTGIYFVRNLRHFDRGAEETDRGQYDRAEYVIGATGAAALYRRAMVDDISIGGEFFDEAFFAYREDADVAWRAQLLGWKCLYVPAAVAWHVRRVTPERRAQLPHAINWHSIKNRFLMRAKNISGRLYLKLLLPVTWRDLLIVGYCLLRDWSMLSALAYPCRHWRKLMQKRREVQRRRRVPDTIVEQWFCEEPKSFPAN